MPPIKSKSKIKTISIGLLLLLSSSAFSTSRSYQNLFSGEWVNNLMKSGINEFSVKFSYRITEQCELVDQKVISTLPESVLQEMPQNYASKVLSRLVGPLESSEMKLSVELNEIQGLKDESISFVSTIESFKQLSVMNIGSPRSNIKCMLKDGVVSGIEFVHQGTSDSSKELIMIDDLDGFTATRIEVIEYELHE